MSKLREVKGDSYMSCEDDRWLPSLSFTEVDLPEAMNWEVGEKYVITIEVELVEISQQDTYSAAKDGGDRYSRMKVRKVGVDEEEYADQAARLLNGK